VNSTYEVLELRAVIKPSLTELYIRCSADSDGGGLVGGWYKTVVGPDRPAIDALREALVSSAYLTEWDRGAPP
jgi:hypothetical protein